MCGLAPAPCVESTRHRARATRENVMSFDPVNRNGTIVDGSGAARYRGDIGITGSYVKRERTRLGHAGHRSCRLSSGSGA